MTFLFFFTQFTRPMPPRPREFVGPLLRNTSLTSFMRSERFFSFPKKSHAQVRVCKEKNPISIPTGLISEPPFPLDQGNLSVTRPYSIDRIPRGGYLFSKGLFASSMIEPSMMRLYLTLKFLFLIVVTDHIVYLAILGTFLRVFLHRVNTPLLFG